MEIKKVKAGMVGLGLVSTPHYKGYVSHPEAEVTAVCDLDEARAKDFAQAHRIPEVYTRYEILANADINTVDIATPTYLHVPMAMEAVRANKHVHCEKPFCSSMGEGLEVCRAARQAGLKLVVGETYAFISSHVKARQLIEAGGRRGRSQSASAKGWARSAKDGEAEIRSRIAAPHNRRLALLEHGYSSGGRLAGLRSRH